MDIPIDCHVHLFPERLFKKIREWFEKVDWRIPYPYKTDEVLAQLRDFGVRECWAMPYAHKPGLAAELNAWMAGVQRQYSMVRGFFTAHPEDEDVGGLAARAVDELGLHGMKIHCEVQQVAVSDPRLDPAFDLLEERGLPCLLHSGDAPYPYTRPHLEAERVAERLAKNPRLKAIVAHLGAHSTRRYLELCETYPGLRLEVSFTNVPGYAEQSRIDFADLAPRADRVLFGSDFPNLTFSYAEQVDNWLKLDWVRQNREAFFGGNARRLLSEE